MERDWAIRSHVNVGPAVHPSQTELDNPELVEAVRAGDGEAVAHVLDVCLPSLRRLVGVRFGLSSEEAEDVLQEVRIAFWRAAPRFRGECSLQTYLVQITRRRCIDHLRARERRSADPLDEHGSTGREDPAVETAVDRLAMAEALEQLSPRQRQVLDLYYVHSKSYREIAAEMGIVIGTVGAMKAEALQKLRRALSDDATQTDAEEKNDG
jgi:RNA polymerase sigma-70 factor (ECF subfamily)